MTEERKGHKGLIHWDIALENTGGDEALLAELIQILVEEEAPKVMPVILDSIDQRDGKTLQISAHRLKGALRVFGPTVAADLAYQLEKMGEDRTFDDAPRVYADLRPQLDSVVVALKTRLGR